MVTCFDTFNIKLLIIIYYTGVQITSLDLHDNEVGDLPDLGLPLGVPQLPFRLPLECFKMSKEVRYSCVGVDERLVTYRDVKDVDCFPLNKNVSVLLLLLVSVCELPLLHEVATPNSTNIAENIIIPPTAPTAINALVTGFMDDSLLSSERVGMSDGARFVFSVLPQSGILSSHKGPVSHIWHTHSS